VFLRKVVPGGASRLTIVDHDETYGRYVLQNMIKGKKIGKCVDLGCGSGDDLKIVGKMNPGSELTGIDFGGWNFDKLLSLGITPISLNIERERLPFEDESIDLVIANQILEHTKEIFWINHEIFRCLKKGGYLFLGVPNVLSFHNRILSVLGLHPTQHKLISAHVRPFSKRDTYFFYEQIGSGFCKIGAFAGSQYYPFPKWIARVMSTLFPNSAFSIFFLIKKTDNYNNDFLEWLRKAKLETNFFEGDS
jgi:ubiquinone/menaquinone biosynthesis C-methylase UbiE